MSRPMPATREASSLSVASAIHCSRPASSLPRIIAAKRRASSPAIESSGAFHGDGEGTARSAHREVSGLRSAAMHSSGAMAAAIANLMELSMTAPCGLRLPYYLQKPRPLSSATIASVALAFLTASFEIVANRIHEDGARGRQCSGSPPAASQRSTVLTLMPIRGAICRGDRPASRN